MAQLWAGLTTIQGTWLRLGTGDWWAKKPERREPDLIPQAKETMEVFPASGTTFSFVIWGNRQHGIWSKWSGKSLETKNAGKWWGGSAERILYLREIWDHTEQNLVTYWLRLWERSDTKPSLRGWTSSRVSEKIHFLKHTRTSTQYINKRQMEILLHVSCT